MSGLTVIARSKAREVPEPAVLECLNPLGNLAGEACTSDGAVLAATYPEHRPSDTSRLSRHGGFTGLLAGDPVTESAFDWKAVFDTVSPGGADSIDFSRMHGAFAVLVHDSSANRISVITDSFGFQPVYLQSLPDGLIVSTALATFLRLGPSAPGIDARWIWEYMFFNYPVFSRTLLEGVERLPAGSITTIDLNDGSGRTTPYAETISSTPLSLSRKDEIDTAVALFHSVVPQWFRAKGRVAFGLSRGLDSRAVLAAVPDTVHDRVSTFTYGIRGSNEITEARSVAEALNYRHSEVFLDQAFLAKLPSLLHETVLLSDTLQVINRAHLPLVYSSLVEAENGVTTIMTGVSGDHIFRDHISAWGNVPYLMSADVAAMHRNGRGPLDRMFYEPMVSDSFTEFEDHIESVLDRLESQYGAFSDPEAYYRYLMYVAGSRYFGGQAAVANQFSTFRTPYWDRRLVQFGMDIELGTTGLSRRLRKKDPFLETIIQASVIARHPELSKVPYMSLPISVFTKKSQGPYRLQRIVRKATTTVTRRRLVEEEDWPHWYRTTMSAEISSLFGADCRVRNYIRSGFIEQQLQALDVHWLGKLITVEIALRLAENDWRRNH